MDCLHFETVYCIMRNGLQYISRLGERLDRLFHKLRCVKYVTSLTLPSVLGTKKPGLHLFNVVYHVRDSRLRTSATYKSVQIFVNLHHI